jgi:transposase InsO family protein
MRDEVLNGETLHSVLEARVVIDRWVEQYNTVRPHRGLGMTTPAVFFESIRTGSR